MTKEEQLMEEIREKYAEHFEEEIKMAELGKIISEEEANNFTDKFHKELFEYIENRKKELNIGTQK